MKISIIEGDVLQASEKYIVHQVNCLGVMGSGLAAHIKDSYPIVYEEYREWCRTKSSLLGLAQFVKVNEGRTIINLFGQLNYGREDKRYTSYDAVYDGLVIIRDEIKAIENFESDGDSDLIKNELAIPYMMSSDRGGADWDVIYEMIKSVFKNTNFTIKIYKFQ